MIGDGGKPAWLRWGGVALGLAIAVLLALWLRDVLLSGKPSKPMKLQQITLIRPLPPPPPPPPPKPPEPEVKEEVKIDEPQPTPEPQQADAPPPDGIPDGPSNSAMQTDLTSGPPRFPSSSNSSNPWGRYDALLNEAVSGAFQQALARDKTLKGKNYKVMVKVWIDSSGKVTRSALVDSTGDARADEVLKEALNTMRALRDVPPAEMPQPVKIRVTSRA